MTPEINGGDESLQIAQRWCEGKGAGWSLGARLGEGGTAPVFEINSPDGLRALKIYNAELSEGKKGRIELKRMEKQLALKGHDCPFLVQIYEGGKFEGRLFLLMSRAPGQELEKRLADVPRQKIRQILGQVAQAAIFLKENGLCHRDIKAANVFVSDDFNHCTLLDISVVRDVTDPIGAGTDQEGQLPFIATARYSPPEYLFRLVDPSPELWHALTVYQLGALLHDLIMREPVFQAEYSKSASNRYRFAWIIATSDPMVQAEDVDHDLMLIAHRALDKNWRRRSGLRLEDFLADPGTQQNHALQFLGLGITRGSIQETDNISARLQRVREVSETLKVTIVQYLRDQGVRTTHDVHPGVNDTVKVISFRWDAPAAVSSMPSPRVELKLELTLLTQHGCHYFGLKIVLSTHLDGKDLMATIDLPEVQDETGIADRIFRHVTDAFPQLAAQISHASGVAS